MAIAGVGADGQAVKAPVTSNNKPNVASQIWSYLTGKGLTPTAAAGVMGNLAQESGLNYTDNGASGLGLAQWMGGRASAEHSLAASEGLSPTSLQAELDYLWQEISAGNQGITVASLNAQTSPQAAALYVSQNYERPAAWAANNSGRENYANIYYQEFTNGGSGAGAPQGGAGTSDATGTTGSASNDVIQNGAAGLFTGIDSALKLKGVSITNPVGSIMNDGRALAFRSFLFIVGVLVIIAGLAMIVVEDSGAADKIPHPQNAEQAEGM